MIPWTDLLALVKELVSSCLKKGTQIAKIKTELRNPGPFSRFLLENRIRLKLGKKMSEWRRDGDAIMQPIYENMAMATDAEIDAIVSTFEEIDWTF